MSVLLDPKTTTRGISISEIVFANGVKHVESDGGHQDGTRCTTPPGMPRCRLDPSTAYPPTVNSSCPSKSPSAHGDVRGRAHDRVGLTGSMRSAPAVVQISTPGKICAEAPIPRDQVRFGARTACFRRAGCHSRRP